MNRILIDKTIFDARLALMEDGNLIEAYVFGKAKGSAAGNIYAGTVTDVVPGMDMAFVDIGSKKKACYHYEKDNKPKNGSQITVQIVKDEFGSKGAYVTENLNFAGRYAVLLTQNQNIFVSKKIKDPEKREALREMTKGLLPEGFGAILRTQAEDIEEEILSDEIKKLAAEAEKTVERAQYIKAPALIYGDEPLIKLSRELFGKNIDEFVVNNREIFNILSEKEEGDERIKLYSGTIPIFTEYCAEGQFEKALAKKVWLKSGGFLIIEETEALTVIDVNTGKFTGRKNKERTFLKANMEAAKEAARQIRLRNLNGIIIIDFIDMGSEEDRSALSKYMANLLRNDRQKAVMAGMTSLNLMQITRKRRGLSLSRAYGRDCASCGGLGFTPSWEYILGKIQRDIERSFSSTGFESLTLRAGEKTIKTFFGDKDFNKKYLENKYKKTINWEIKENMPDFWYEITK